MKNIRLLVMALLSFGFVFNGCALTQKKELYEKKLDSEYDSVHIMTPFKNKCYINNKKVKSSAFLGREVKVLPGENLILQEMDILRYSMPKSQSQVFGEIVGSLVFNSILIGMGNVGVFYPSGSRNYYFTPVDVFIKQNLDNENLYLLNKVSYLEPYKPLNYIPINLKNSDGKSLYKLQYQKIGGPIINYSINGQTDNGFFLSDIYYPPQKRVGVKAFFSDNKKRCVLLRFRNAFLPTKIDLIVDGIKIDSYDKYTNPFFSPDSNKFVFVGKRNGYWYIVENGKEIASYKTLPWGLSYSPDSKELVYIAKEDKKFFIVKNGQQGKKYDYILPGWWNHQDNTYNFFAEFGNSYKFVSGQEEFGSFESISPAFDKNKRKYNDSKFTFFAKKDDRWILIYNKEKINNDYEFIVPGSLITNGDQKAFIAIKKYTETYTKKRVSSANRKSDSPTEEVTKVIHKWYLDINGKNTEEYASIYPTTPLFSKNDDLLYIAKKEEDSPWILYKNGKIIKSFNNLAIMADNEKADAINFTDDPGKIFVYENIGGNPVKKEVNLF